MCTWHQKCSQRVEAGTSYMANALWALLWLMPLLWTHSQTPSPCCMHIIMIKNPRNSHKAHFMQFCQDSETTRQPLSDGACSFPTFALNYREFSSDYSLWHTTGTEEAKVCFAMGVFLQFILLAPTPSAAIKLCAEWVGMQNQFLTFIGCKERMNKWIFMRFKPQKRV